ncbi:uncharacterized protein LOC135168550 isoform X2 [Diachasmimorpha longicaudata]|uniref:uncharacterized protein LOC135168550 isoform X2 n=1 Tax=Diachasmimorpha longicaudata TaxID=58733 RepID=UPI0030B8D84B
MPEFNWCHWRSPQKLQVLLAAGYGPPELQKEVQDDTDVRLTLLDTAEGLRTGPKSREREKEKQVPSRARKFTGYGFLCGFLMNNDP